MELRTVIHAEAAIRAFEMFPEVMERHLHGATRRGAHEVAREEKLILAENRSMARSTLANSIRVQEVAKMHHRVVAGAAYARMVEEGTRPGYMPPPERLMDYVRQRARPGSLRDRAWGLAKHILKHGTRAHPFARPAAERKTPKIRELVTLASIAGIREAFYS